MGIFSVYLTILSPLLFCLVLKSNVSVTLVNLISHGLSFNEPLIPASALWCKVLLHYKLPEKEKPTLKIPPRLSKASACPNFLIYTFVVLQSSEQTFLKIQLAEIFVNKSVLTLFPKHHYLFLD